MTLPVGLWLMYCYATYGNRSYLVWLIFVVWMDTCWDVRHHSRDDGDDA
jgi:hypothetical protein